MATRVLLPKQGLQMVEGKIIRWLKKQGDDVVEGEPLVEIETDKTTLEIDALATGCLLAVLRKEGETVPVAETIAVIGAKGEDISAITAGGGTANASSSPAAGAAAAQPSAPMAAAAAPRAATDRLFATPRARMTAEQAKIDINAVPGSGPDGLVIERDVKAYAEKAGRAPSATHLAERVAQQSGVDLRQVNPSTPGGRIRKNDVLQFAAAAGSGQPAASAGGAAGSVVAPSRMRAIIARRMKESLQTAAQTDMQVDVDCTEMTRMREGFKKSGKNVTFTDILVKIIGCSLRKHPVINSSWTDNGVLMRSEVNVGMAIGLDEGLIVPVIRDVDALSIEAINAVSRDLIAKAKEGKLQPQDLEGAGFTISNLGMFGIDRFTAIINQPESAILAVGRIVDKPLVVDKTVQVRPQMTLTLSYDHRVIDGAPAAKFLATVREYIQNPYLLIY